MTPSEAERRRIESPCVGICVIEEASGLCAGCRRTLEEIAAWSSAPAAERRRIIAAVEARSGVDIPDAR